MPFRIKNNERQQGVSDSDEGYDRSRQQIAEMDNRKSISEMQESEIKEIPVQEVPEEVKKVVSSVPQDYIQKQVQEPPKVQSKPPIIESDSNELFSKHDVLRMLKADKEMQVKERIIMIRNVLDEILGDTK